MYLTKYGHACVRLESDGRALVIDPGAMTPEPEALAGVEAALITHEHFDHFEAERLSAAAANDPRFAVYTCPGVARHLTDLHDQVRVVRDGDVVHVAGLQVRVIGEKHHHSHPDVPPVENVGFLVEDEVFHPGDALTVVDVPTLLVVGQAPWMTVPDLIGCLRRAAPRRAYAIHDGLLNRWGWTCSTAYCEARRSGYAPTFGDCSPVRRCCSQTDRACLAGLAGEPYDDDVGAALVDVSKPLRQMRNLWRHVTIGRDGHGRS
ncbi:MBL fold metallo-hydrolase [Micromonospora sp. WMMA1363]|uniref:MBL fold metallo-hydrolase n=1 Tax=Micromonospora sp. WMMA1363 TaxID=3053985 RepID=UPI00259CB7CB|nr:MBL fold metallo-hydrolase [Micromonospora sp. WMMA1363]MDM4722272.1 MBL fold metallo-hydrolase [Micromonospora sp. WMMA1363]